MTWVCLLCCYSLLSSSLCPRSVFQMGTRTTLHSSTRSRAVRWKDIPAQNRQIKIPSYFPVSNKCGAVLWNTLCVTNFKVTSYPVFPVVTSGSLTLCQAPASQELYLTSFHLLLATGSTRTTLLKGWFDRQPHRIHSRPTWA